jgi:hypothetical protein
VAGVKAMDVDLTRIKEDYEVELRPEPSNLYDRNAIQIVAWYGKVKAQDGHVLGYVPRVWAQVLKASDWTATVAFVCQFQGQPAGLRLNLDRRQAED